MSTWNGVHSSANEGGGRVGAGVRGGGTGNVGKGRVRVLSPSRRLAPVAGRGCSGGRRTRASGGGRRQETGNHESTRINQDQECPACAREGRQRHREVWCVSAGFVGRAVAVKWLRWVGGKLCALPCHALPCLKETILLCTLKPVHHPTFPPSAHLVTNAVSTPCPVPPTPPPTSPEGSTSVVVTLPRSPTSQ